MKVRTCGAEVGRIVTVRVDGHQDDITLGDFVLTSHGSVYEVVRVHRVKSGKTAGRYELRGRVHSQVPEGAKIHRIEYNSSRARPPVDADA